ncbi:Sodium- and chloride-dependent GABA transporter ine [Amphibalanus amphitrite]|uniref:Transporter n=1 Tax=Amphibalanus amphitrite TaxID=1232801 RepID=A0A6A4WYK2_AMPAM|nr:Sodium- and chloride-dependent GABA transporter ine [Amphibalanus amphitrite]
MRTNWSNKIEFVLACLGYAVGLGNLWRFPYMCYNSGGGAFLIPYYIMMFVCSIPLLLMELAVGQFTQRGPVGAMARLCPLFKGAGLATVVISFLFCSYYNVVIAWALYYMFASFQSQIPWASCNNTWNTATCHDASAAERHAGQERHHAIRGVLLITGGIEEIGSMRWPIFLTLLLAWILVYFSLWKSVKSSGKVWVNAAAQNFNSVGIAFGSMIAFASYNKVNNRSIMLDTMVICCLNSATSILAGIIVFATLGNIAHELQSKIEDVVTAGPGLVFVIYPKALAGMPVPQLWAFLFFFMLLCLGLDSQFATLEVVITTLQDAYGKWIKAYLKRHEVLVLLMCFVSFVLGLPHVMQGGMFVFQLMDYYVAGISLMFLAFFEVIAVTWVYGTERLSRDYAAMTGARPLVYFQVCWRFLAPFLILAIWIFSLIDYERPSYDGYHYPEWGIRLGWFLASLSYPADTVVRRGRAVPGHRQHPVAGELPVRRHRLMNAIQPDPTLYTKPDPEYFNEGLELESGAASKADLVTVASTRGDGFPSAPPTAV